MTVNLADADRAVRAVMSGIGRHIDPAIRATLNARRSARGAADLFVLLDQATWQTDVTNYYNAYFAGIVGGNLAGVLLGCCGFTTPLSHRIRRLFVPTTSNYGTLVHEFVHWLQHMDAYPAFYETDVDGPYWLEGVTEYFTRKIHAPGRAGHYDAQLQSVQNALAGAAVTEDALGAWSFRGGLFPAGLHQFR